MMRLTLRTVLAGTPGDEDVVERLEGVLWEVPEALQAQIQKHFEPYHGSEYEDDAVPYPTAYPFSMVDLIEVHQMEENRTRYVLYESASPGAKSVFEGIREAILAQAVKPIDLNAVLYREERATMGPWASVFDWRVFEIQRQEWTSVSDWNGLEIKSQKRKLWKTVLTLEKGSLEKDDPNLNFVLEARTDVPALMAVVEAMKRTLLLVEPSPEVNRALALVGLDTEEKRSSEREVVRRLLGPQAPLMFFDALME